MDSSCNTKGDEKRRRKCLLCFDLLHFLFIHFPFWLQARENQRLLAEWLLVGASWWQSENRCGLEGLSAGPLVPTACPHLPLHKVTHSTLGHHSCWGDLVSSKIRKALLLHFGVLELEAMELWETSNRVHLMLVFCFNLHITFFDYSWNLNLNMLPPTVNSFILPCWYILSILTSYLFIPLSIPMFCHSSVSPFLSISPTLPKATFSTNLISLPYLRNMITFARRKLSWTEKKRFSLWFITFWLGCNMLWYFCMPCQDNLVHKKYVLQT